MYLDYQIPVIQLKGPKGGGDMQETMEICKQKSEIGYAPPPRSQYMVMWAVYRLAAMGVRVCRY